MNLPCKVIFTSRNDHSDYPTVMIGPIGDPSTVRDLFAANLGRALKPDEQETVDEILRLVDYHTITVELIAKQMKASFLSPKNMLKRLQETGTNTHLKEKIHREGSTEKLGAFDYIRGLFQFSGLGEAERHLLACMSFVPAGGIRVPVLGELLGLEDYDTVNDLLGKNWLMLDEEESILRLHPVVCDVVRDQLQPTPENCSDYVEGLSAKAWGFWDMEIGEREMLYPLVVRLLTLFPEPPASLFRAYSRMISAPWICGDFLRAQKVAEDFYHYAVKEFGSETDEAALAAMYVAAAFHNAGRYAEAEPWYVTALEIRKKVLDPDDVELATSWSKVARCGIFRGDFAAAEEGFREARRILDRNLEAGNVLPGYKYPRYYGAVLLENGRLLMAEGRFEEALEMSKKTMEVFVECDQLANIQFVWVDRGSCLSQLGRYDEAQECFEKAYKINLELNGHASMSTVKTRESMADNLRLKGDEEGARAIYSELELDLEQDFGAENPQVTRLREKKEGKIFPFEVSLA